MCGIFAAVTADGNYDISAELRRWLCSRGPDHVGCVETRCDAPDATVCLSFTSTVLALRGDHVTRQPFVSHATGSVLCWNGEAWKVDGGAVDGNDGEAIFNRLMAAKTSTANEDSILDVFRSVEGPFAFVYFDRATACLYYGRDRLGRRSLLVNDRNGLLLSSISDSPNADWREVEADGIYAVDLSQPPPIKDDAASDALFPHSVRHDWVTNAENHVISSIGSFNTALPEQPFLLTAQSPPVMLLGQHLALSMRDRVLGVPKPPSDGPGADTRVAILFSGGLDCTVLARVAHDIVPTDQGIDLFNVAFENPRIAAQMKKQPGAHVDVDDDIFEACPDRVTGRKSFAELQVVCPARPWRFVAVNVPYSETKAHRAQVISLIYPHNTEMDLSIAYALYFAARGRGICYTSPGAIGEIYSSPARVLLSGLGADELFGGYTRHTTAFSRQGYPGLIDELKLDVGRLGKRNLGRDDRVMAHWGREVRFPFLDETLVRWAIGCPVWEKCDFENQGESQTVEAGKRVLRLLAEELGMAGVAREKKRAIQFGSRTAKMESGKVKGTSLLS